jgi:hypothetical protein
MKFKFHWTVKLTFVSQEKVSSPLLVSSSNVAKIVEGRAEGEAWPRHSLARSLKPENRPSNEMKRMQGVVEEERRKVNLKFTNFGICS